MSDIAAEIRAKREALYLTKTEAAHRAGISYTTWQNVERGCAVSGATLGKIRQALQPDLSPLSLHGEAVVAAIRKDSALSLEDRDLLERVYRRLTKR